MNYFNYFTEIEDTFIRRRGRHLLLSPKDWALIESWQQMGVPLHIALRGIEQSFDSFQATPRRRTVKSLLYCQEEVEAQFAEWLTTQRGATPNGLQETPPEKDNLQSQRILAHLTRTREMLATSIRRRSADALCEMLQHAADALVKLQNDFAHAAQPDAERLEASLEQWEQRIDEALRQSLAPAELTAARASAATQLKPYRAAMEAAIYQQTLDNLLLKRLRERHAIPRLSLFYL